MNKKTLTALVAVIAVVGVVAVVMATRQKTSLQEPPTDTGGQVSEVDTSNWFAYTNTRLKYSVLIPTGFENRAIYEDTKLDFDSTASGINAVKGDSVINITTEDEVLFEGEGELSERLLRRVKDGGSRLFNADGNIFIENLASQNGRSFATTTQDVVLTLTFRNVDESVMRTVLKGFRFHREEWLSVPQSTIQVIKQYLVANHGFRDIDNVVIRVVEVAGNGIYGKVSTRIPSSGAQFLAEDRDGHLRMIYVGQDALPCAEVEAFGFSSEKVDVCWDSQNNVLKKR